MGLLGVVEGGWSSVCWYRSNLKNQVHRVVYTEK